MIYRKNISRTGILNMVESFISPFHGGIAFDRASGDSLNHKIQKIEFIYKSCSIKNGLRRELDSFFSALKPDIGISPEEKLAKCINISEECVKRDELRILLSRKDYTPICYDGFEPSGRMHISQGFGKVYRVNEMSKLGIRNVLWIADWFAMLNDKVGGNLDRIRIVGEYFIHVWKAAGMDTSSVKFLWASEEINKNPDLYWKLVMDITRSFNITRLKRCSQALGRTEGDDRPAATLLYPAMQCADIFYIGADICQLGMDQRKINMLAREYCDLKNLEVKPIILSHKMLPGLLQGQGKMSKANQNSAIFMEDSEEDVIAKIKKAYCPPGIVEENPCLSYFTDIVFTKFSSVTISRDAGDGGDIIFNSPEELTACYASEKLHPVHLKASLAKYLNMMLQPVREYFENNKEAKLLALKVAKFMA